MSTVDGNILTKQIMIHLEIVYHPLDMKKSVFSHSPGTSQFTVQ